MDMDSRQCSARPPSSLPTGSRLKQPSARFSPGEEGPALCPAAQPGRRQVGRRARQRRCQLPRIGHRPLQLDLRPHSRQPQAPHRSAQPPDGRQVAQLVERAPCQGREQEPLLVRIVAPGHQEQESGRDRDPPPPHSDGLLVVDIVCRVQMGPRVFQLQVQVGTSGVPCGPHLCHLLPRGHGLSRGHTDPAAMCVK